MQLKALYSIAKKRFENADIPTAALEAQLLLAKALDKDITFIFSNPEIDISERLCDKFRKIVNRRVGGEPSAYIKGIKQFYSMDFIVTPDVLIPRPETELLVEESLKLLSTMNNPTVLDLGTGSGCIAITIKKEFNNCKVVATDISISAIKVAKKNLLKHKLYEKVSLLNANLIGCFASSSFDIIISNPPYIAKEEFEYLDNELKSFEPKTALISENGGLNHITAIIENCTDILKNGGWCILEIGYNQSEKVYKLFLDNGFTNIEIIKDINNINRVVKGQCRK